MSRGPQALRVFRMGHGSWKFENHWFRWC